MIEMIKQQLSITKSFAKKRQAKSGVVPSLGLEILKDIVFKQGVISGLLFLLVASAMIQAQNSNQVRRAVAQSQSLREQTQKEQIQSQTLRLELTSLSEADRVSSLASKKVRNG
ncbi:MAG: cell division protein FtsL [Enterobacterales bacterium]|nr:cell division protein FtsL [Enterobacterales bacterium]